MYAPGHFGIALLCVAPLATILHLYGYRRAAQVGTVSFLLTATAPDIDLYIAAIPHRGITHSIAAAGTTGLVFGLGGALVHAPGLGGRLRDFFFGFGVGTLGLSTHLLGDVITPMGIRPFAPFLNTHYTLELVYASDPSANAGFLLAGLVMYRLSVGAARLLVPLPMTTESDPVSTLGETDAEMT